MEHQNTHEDDAAKNLDPGEDLVVTQTSPQPAGGGGTCVSGTLGGHRFEALIFHGHADNPEHEIQDSRISKLWLRRQSDRREVYHWDRGLDHGPEDARAAAIVDFLVAGLAEHVDGG